MNLKFPSRIRVAVMRQSMSQFTEAAKQSVRAIGFPDPAREKAERPESVGQAGAGSVKSWNQAIRKQRRKKLSMRVGRRRKK